MIALPTNLHFEQNTGLGINLIHIICLILSRTSNVLECMHLSSSNMHYNTNIPKKYLIRICLILPRISLTLLLQSVYLSISYLSNIFSTSSSFSLTFSQVGYSVTSQWANTCKYYEYLTTEKLSKTWLNQQTETFYIDVRSTNTTRFHLSWRIQNKSSFRLFFGWQLNDK